ncbi:hypothetical protein V5P93_005501 [Actinokineospora auranticolor]|nr:hypothetical protein [Actinokineospora auranticolor]
MDNTETLERLIPRPRVNPDLIGGRAPSWPPTTPEDDEEYEPTIVRGRD